ncbi:MAG: hypothetical protein M3R38_37730 [Actinomycetota bacterium]|nr:hypothetical protein [Actinomycetota bacterium]
MPYTAAKLLEDMQEAIQEADREGARESEIEDCMMRAFRITREIMDARREHIQTLEEEMAAMEAMAERKGRFTRRISGDDQAHNAS